MAEIPQVTAFQRLIEDHVTEFINASRHFGEPLTAMAYMVKRAFDQELNFIVTGLNMLMPDADALKNMVEPISGVIREIQEFRDRNRHVEEFFNHLSTVSESIVALSWISVRPAPVQFVRDMRDAGDYFGNRVLYTNKGENMPHSAFGSYFRDNRYVHNSLNNQRHQNWINKWNDILKALELYVKTYHLTGFSWGITSGISGPSVAPGLPPPPPPPPNYDPMAGGDDRHALLNQINQGVDIVRMLRPVRREPGSQSQHTAGGTDDSQSRRPQAEKTYPPKFFLEGRKWRVEHQKDNYSLTIENDEMSQSLAMFKCQNVGLEVRNKMNGASIDNCKRSTIVLHDIISSVELIRCENIKLQCSGHVPLVSLDNCDSIQVFLTDKSIGAELISSKSTSLNVCLLAPDGDYTELAVPEQIKTVVVDRRLQSTVVEKM